MASHITPDGIRLNYVEHGSGSALVLLHGLGSRAADWDDHLPVLSPRRRCIAIDMRGHGASDEPPGPYTPTLHAQDALSLLDGLEIRSADVLGYSMGGAAAFAMAVAAPSRVRSLCIVNSVPSFALDTMKIRFELFVRRTVIGLFGVERLAGLVSRRLFPKPEQQDLRDRAVDSIKRNSKDAYLASLNGLAGWSVADQIGAIAAPTLLVCGDRDYTPVEAKKAAADAMPDARLVVVEDAGHGMPLEKLEEFNAILADWLDGLDTP